MGHRQIQAARLIDWDGRLNHPMLKQLFKAITATVKGLDHPLESGIKLSSVKDIQTTPIKNQGRTHTHWSFAIISFIEAELLRMGKAPTNLSEMFIVRKTYPKKATQYIRLNGKMAFSADGLAGDALQVLRKHGLVPESVYSGKPDGESQYNNVEMDAMLKAALDSILTNQESELSKTWPRAIDGILDAYLGRVPESFSFDGNSYTAKSFVEKLPFDPDDYIQLTSYSHHPFYTTFSLEIEENWASNKYLNVPLNEFMAVMDHALENGYSLVWHGDITDKSFSLKKGVAIHPLKNWEDRTQLEKDRICEVSEPEKQVTQELRQDVFDSLKFAHNHHLHIVGVAYDENGKRYYKAKDSRGLKDSRYNGFVYMSESYIQAKTFSIMVHKEALLNKIVEQLQGKEKESIGETWFFEALKEKKR